MQTAAASWAQWPGKLIRQSTCFQLEHTSAFQKEIPAGQKKLLQHQDKKSKQKNSQAVNYSQSLFHNINNRSFSLFSCLFKGWNKAKLKHLLLSLPLHLPFLERSLSHLSSASQRKGLEGLQKKGSKYNLKVQELNQAFLPGCKA